MMWMVVIILNCILFTNIVSYALPKEEFNEEDSDYNQLIKRNLFIVNTYDDHHNLDDKLQ